MKSSVEEITPIIGTAMGGGFYAGRIQIGEQVFALIVAPKAEGEIEEAEWIADEIAVPGALSYFDGVENTNAMAATGSDLAIQIRALRIAGHDDWYLPAQDELEVIYRNLKPTERKNYCWARSGINLSALPPTRPYTPDFPLQTQAEAFRAGGAEAFAEDYYWSSTQHAADSYCAWSQVFDYGNQYSSYTNDQWRARAVRRLPI